MSNLTPPVSVRGYAKSLSATQISMPPKTSTVNKIVMPPIGNELSILQQKITKAVDAAKQFEVDNSKLKALAEDAYQELLSHRNTIKFEYNYNGSDELVVKIVNKSSGRLLWQFPPTSTIELQKLAAHMPGIFMDSTI